MTEHPYTLAQETVVISAFKNGVSVDVIAEVIGKSPASVEKLLKKIGLKTNARKAQGDDEGGAEPSETNVPEQFRKGDLVSLIDRFVVQLSQVFMLRVFPVGTIC